MVSKIGGFARPNYRSETEFFPTFEANFSAKTQSIKNGFNTLVRCLGGMTDKKNRRTKIS
jgi:hypothetical protein